MHTLSHLCVCVCVCVCARTVDIKIEKQINPNKLTDKKTTCRSISIFISTSSTNTVCVFVCLCVFLQLDVCAYMYVCIYLCVCVWRGAFKHRRIHTYIHSSYSVYTPIYIPHIALDTWMLHRPGTRSSLPNKNNLLVLCSPESQLGRANSLISVLRSLYHSPV